MHSTLVAEVPPYIGVDLTDRYSAQCRSIDVCGLTPAGSKRLNTCFWHWHWDRAPHGLEVTAIVNELRGARVAMIDGPQALAEKGAALRVCERQSAAVGKTPDTRPSVTKPFGGFICSSLDLFTALAREEIAISPPACIGGVFEVYPGHIWTILSGRRRLPKKATDAGRLARKCLLEALGVCGLPELPTHDQNDACVAATLAAAADNQISGVHLLAIGTSLSIDPDGVLREGPMMIPQLVDWVANRMPHTVGDLHFPESTRPSVVECASVPVATECDDLLARFIDRAVEGIPEVCTYAWAYRALVNASYGRFSQAYARQVIDLARGTRPRELPGLGLVRLDAFIVAKKDRLPSAGHWPAAHYDREEWERTLGNAKLLD